MKKPKKRIENTEFASKSAGEDGELMPTQTGHLMSDEGGTSRLAA